MMALCLETAWEPPRDCRQCSARDGHESARHETLCLLVLTHPLCPFGKVELKCCGPRDDDDKQACFYMNDRIIRIYGRSWNTHARRTRNERSCQSRSRVASGHPSLTGLTGPRTNLSQNVPPKVRLSVVYIYASRYQKISTSSSSSSLHRIILLTRTLLSYVGRNDGDKGLPLRDFPRRPLRDLISSRHRLGVTVVTTVRTSWTMPRSGSRSKKNRARQSTASLALTSPLHRNSFGVLGAPSDGRGATGNVGDGAVGSGVSGESASRSDAEDPSTNASGVAEDLLASDHAQTALPADDPVRVETAAYLRQ